ncbi:MAG: glycyl-radical enzyme activating protein [Candidatus Hermodarchaeota archaeon]
MKGIVFDIQNYAIYDGPGIRTIIFLIGCPLKCIWCQNPESQELKPQLSYFSEKCIGCGSCVAVCPNNALQLIDGKVIRDQARCTVCGQCVNACPHSVRDIIGKYVSVEELVELVKRDKIFYDNSGGGVTISGGEPTMQLEFLLNLLEALKNVKIHTAIETCGYFREDIIPKLSNLVDLFLFDIKHIDSEIHCNFTGVPNDRILTNFKSILSKVGNKRITPRIPLIPSVNTNKDIISKIGQFLFEAKYKGPIHLMPYNKLARTKYEKIGKADLYRDMGDLTEETIKKIIETLEQQSFQVIVNH